MKIIPKNIAGIILRERSNNGANEKYRTNKLANCLLLLFELKNSTKSGIIHYLPNESKTNFCKRIASIYNISSNTVASRLSYLSSNGYINHIPGKYLQLTSWKKICKKLIVPNAGFTEITDYTIENLYKLMICEKKADMSKELNKKYKNLVTEYPNFYDRYLVGNISAAKIDQIQQYIFINGSDSKDFTDLLFSLNPRLECNLYTWSSEAYLKNASSFYYWLKKMHNNKLIKYTPGIIIKSKKNVHLPFTKWNTKSKCSFWHQTGTIETLVN